HTRSTRDWSSDVCSSDLIVQTSDYGLSSSRTLVLGGIAVALLGAFVVRQARGRNPILPLRVFRSRKVAGTNIVQALMSTSFFSLDRKSVVVGKERGSRWG